jgi:hypothetical protein
MTGIIRIELATTQALALMEQFHSEIHQRLDFIEDHLNVQVAKANANPAFAETLVGTSRMTEVVVKASLKQASMVFVLYLYDSYPYIENTAIGP